MVARSWTISSDISVFIDPETILLRDFLSTLSYAHELDHDWFLFALSRGVSYFPFHLDQAGRNWLGEDGRVINLLKLQEFLSVNWQLHCFEGRMLMAWSNSEVPLHMGILPPFLYGKGLHNNWVINEVLHSNFRFLFDASRTVSNFYLFDLDGHESDRSAKETAIQEIEMRGWEYSGNRHLGSLYGQLYFRGANFTSLVKLVKCDGKFMFSSTGENVVCSTGQQGLHSLWKGKLINSMRENEIVDCLSDVKSHAGVINCSIMNHLNHSVELHLPYSMESLLPIVADRNKTIVLAVAGYSYKDMLMSWVCRLRGLLITNFLICALDDDIYKLSVLQGLPVFRDPLAPSNISFNDCHFGTKCFQKVTKTKSRLVLQILKLGYNVLLSDVDIYWFRNPIPLLQSFGPAVLAAQSDEFNATGPINLPRRLNSGFYFAHSDNSTIAAMEKVVMHALTSGLSEQPSFYDTLCGENGSNRVGYNKCWEPETNLTVHFLNRDLFPNGAYQGLWGKRNVKAACIKKDCYILHNNWISGRMKKLVRQVSAGLWDYDISSRMCLQSWHKTKVESYV
ncbi:Beta-arabinofuranosyltransferase ray1 [Ancistrocladus abbreviatus]